MQRPIRALWRKVGLGRSKFVFYARVTGHLVPILVWVEERAEGDAVNGVFLVDNDQGLCNLVPKHALDVFVLEVLVDNGMTGVHQISDPLGPILLRLANAQIPCRGNVVIWDVVE